MAIEVILHTRQFSDTLQREIKEECMQRGFHWRGFEEVELIKRELDMGIEYVKELLPESLHEHIQSKVDPFNYHIDFYLSIGYED